jgi:phosphomannomutase / phosphoglucomutase
MSQPVEARGAWPPQLPKSGRDPITFATEFLPDSIFREYDIRGTTLAVAPDTSHSVNGFVANRLGRAFGTYLAQRGHSEIAVGHDSRSYSEALALAFIAGLLSTGRTVRNIGLATSPMVYYSQHALGGIAGTVVTASHNPNGWAGFKLAAEPSVTLGPEEIAEVKEIAESRDFTRGEGSYVEVSLLNEYVDEVVARVGAMSSLHVVLDGGNSISGAVAQRVFEAAGHRVTPVNLELDWTFPNHEPDPEAVAARRQIADAVLECNAEAGFSFDGDGDRLGVTDEAGEIVWSDLVLALMARDALERHPGASIVYDVKCSRAVTEVIRSSGGVPVMWKTGHSHIKAKAREIGAPFSGERSGHLFDAGDYYGFDDAIYAGLRCAQIIAKSGSKVSELVQGLPHYVTTPTMHAHCPDEVKYSVIDALRPYVASVPGVQEIIDVNGIRAEFAEGWFLVRASSNIPALVIVVEATTDSGLRALYDIVRQGLAQHPEVEGTWDNDPFTVSE